jgi:HEAT repeat protein
MGQAAAPAVPALTELLHSRDHAEAAAYALSRIGPAAASATEDLLALLINKDHSACTAAEALASIDKRGNAAKVLPSIVPLLSSPDMRVRRHAVLVLGQFGDAASAAVPTLQKMYDTEDDDKYIDKEVVGQVLDKIKGTNTHSGSPTRR